MYSSGSATIGDPYHDISSSGKLYHNSTFAVAVHTNYRNVFESFM